MSARKPRQWCWTQWNERGLEEHLGFSGTEQVGRCSAHILAVFGHLASPFPGSNPLDSWILGTWTSCDAADSAVCTKDIRGLFSTMASRGRPALWHGAKASWKDQTGGGRGKPVVRTNISVASVVLKIHRLRSRPSDTPSPWLGTEASEPILNAAVGRCHLQLRTRTATQVPNPSSTPRAVN